MPKFYLSISVFFVSIFSFSQNLYNEGTWMLEYLSIDNVFYLHSNEYPKTDDNGNRILLNFHQSVTPNFDTTVCGLIEVQFSEDVDEYNNFTILSTKTTLDSCNNLGDQDFENLYFSFFQSSTTYNYQIGCLLSGSACYLTIYSPNGDEASFWNGELSINSNDKLAFSIYPNPVKDKLFISSPNNSKTSNIEIFDVLGRHKITKKLTTESLNVESLSKGVYFLIINDGFGNTTTKKFIK